MALFGKKKPKLPSYVGASLEALLQDPEWSFAIGQAGIDPSRCEVVLRLASCTVGDSGMPTNASPALLLGQGKTLAVAFPGEREIRVVKRDAGRAELQTQRSGMFQIMFGPASSLDGFMFYGHEDNLVANTPEGDAFGQAMLAFLGGKLQPQQVVGTPQSLSASASGRPSAQPSAAPDFADPDDATRWHLVHTLHSSLVDMMDKNQLCFEKAEHIEKAHSLTTIGHESSRESFRRAEERAEKELEALLVDLRSATENAREQWSNLMFLLPEAENDTMKLANWCMANGVDGEVLSSVAVNSAFLNSNYGTTKESFWAENNRIAALFQQQYGEG